ncbi:MAG TPA: histidine kinase dimerization/phospho-acceptor domain-containing protein, partial [Gemmatimonadales bacterium]|nr:histidine kinase dimerization/phospho-acceptor domain-containing protein [Gemmatimonadales bacterium]
LVINETSDAMTVSGPIPLVQGGLGLILRRRFRRPAVTGYDIAALVLDLDPLLAEAGLLHPARVRIAIRDSVGRLLYGSPEVGQEAPVVVPVRIPNNVWQLEAVPTAGWDAAIRARLSLFTGGVVLSGTLLLLVVYLVASRQAALVAAVDERTRSLRAAVDELHEAANERERTEAQLRQSQRLESLGRLAGGIAHDFNNLLTVIIGSLSLARMGVAAESELAGDLATAELAAERASALSRKLLVFARRQAVEYQAVDLNTLLGELRPIVLPLLGERVRLVEELAPGLWPVFADPGQLEQIITNLAVNSRDAMPDGGTLTLRTRNVELPAPPAGGSGPVAGAYVRLEV